MTVKSVTFKKDTSGTPMPTQMRKPSEVTVSYAPGDIIFSQGDQGGDLLFIQSGAVEIFLNTERQQVVLTRMSAGEIIGVMTFLTKDQRMASARAVEPSTIKKIPSQQVQRHIELFPKWLKIVLKEFVGRIAEMNRLYSEASHDLRKAREMQITSLFLATQLAQALHIVARGLVKDPTADSLVASESLRQNLQLTLNQPKEMIDRIMMVFHESGLLQYAKESSAAKSYQLSTLEKAAIFTQFVRESTQGASKKILKSRLTIGEIAQTKALGSYAIKKKMPEDKVATVATSALKLELEIETGIAFDLSLLDRALKLGLVTQSGEGDAATLAFIPVNAVRTMSCIEAMRSLTTSVDGFELPISEDTVKSAS